jgi:hypothetical protein
MDQRTQVTQSSPPKTDNYLTIVLIVLGIMVIVIIGVFVYALFHFQVGT